jgi:hypothetical protein
MVSVLASQLAKQSSGACWNPCVAVQFVCFYNTFISFYKVVCFVIFCMQSIAMAKKVETTLKYCYFEANILLLLFATCGFGLF